MTLQPVFLQWHGSREVATEDYTRPRTTQQNWSWDLSEILQYTSSPHLNKTDWQGLSLPPSLQLESFEKTNLVLLHSWAPIDYSPDWEECVHQSTVTRELFLLHFSYFELLIVTAILLEYWDKVSVSNSGEVKAIIRLRTGLPRLTCSYISVHM